MSLHCLSFTYQPHLLLPLPPLNLRFAGTGQCESGKGLRIFKDDWTADFRVVSAAFRRVVLEETLVYIIRRADIERPIGTLEDVDVKHTDSLSLYGNGSIFRQIMLS